MPAIETSTSWSRGLHPEKTSQQIGQGSALELHRPAIGIEVERLCRGALRRCPVEDEERVDFETVILENNRSYSCRTSGTRRNTTPRLVLLRSVDRAEIQRAARRIDGFPARPAGSILVKPSRRLVRRVIRLLPEAGVSKIDVMARAKPILQFETALRELQPLSFRRSLNHLKKSTS